MVDAYMSFTGVTGPIPGVPQGPGAFATATLSETLSNGVVLSLLSPGATSTSFPAVGSLSAIKDQDNSAYNGDFSSSSVLVDAFSVNTSVPEPGTIALFGAGLLGSALWLSRRRRAKSI